MAREGAEVTIVYLPQEQSDAEEVKSQIERESKNKNACLLLPLDLMQRENCLKAVEGKSKSISPHGTFDEVLMNGVIVTYGRACKAIWAY